MATQLTNKPGRAAAANMPNANWERGQTTNKHEEKATLSDGLTPSTSSQQDDSVFQKQMKRVRDWSMKQVETEKRQLVRLRDRLQGAEHFENVEAQRRAVENANERIRATMKCIEEKRGQEPQAHPNEGVAETAHANQGAWSDPVPLSAACNVRCKANDAYLEAVGKVAKALNVCGAFVLDVPADKLIVARSVMDFCDALFFKQSQAKRMELAKAANLPEQLCARTDHGAALLQFKMGQGLPEPFCGQHDLASSAFETLDEVARTALQLVCAALKLGSRDACTHALEDPIAGSTTSCSSVTWFGYGQGAHLPEHIDRGLVTLVYAPYDAGSSATELMITRDAAAGWHKLTLRAGQVCVLVGHTLARFANTPNLAPKHFAPTVGAHAPMRRTCVYRLKARGDAVIVDGKTAKQIEAELGHSINTAQVGPSTPVARDDGAGASSSRRVKRGRDNNNFVVKVKGQDGIIHEFNISKHTKMSVVFRAYAQIKKVDERSLNFLFGERIGNDDTPKSLGLEEDDEIDAM